MIKDTLENKAKFFALYWGQKAAKFKIGKGCTDILTLGCDNQYSSLCDNKNYGFENAFLELKPLSSISDKDAINGAILFQEIKVDNDIIDIKRYKDCIGFNILHEGCNFKTCYTFFHYASNPSRLRQYHIDYLRSKGYALPWMGISVEEQVKRGWVVLSEKIEG